MAIVRRVGPGSAFKVGLVLYALIGLVLGICMAFVSMVAGTLGSMGQSAAPGARLFGFFPLIYGLIGGVFGAIGAAIYNLAAGWVGGLEVDIN